MLRKFRIPMLALIVAMHFSLLHSFPAMAALVPSMPSQATAGDQAKVQDIDTIQKALEEKIVADKLAAYGLSTAEVKAKLENMSSSQLHMLAQASDRLLSGGDGAGLIISVLIIVILVIIILKLLNKKIVIG